MLVLAQANINGLTGKEFPASMYIKEKEIDIMFLCETWLPKNQYPQLSHIVSVNSFEKTGNIVGGRRGLRGLICLVKHSIKNQVQEVYKSEDGLYIIVKYESYYYASVYLPPSLPDEMLATILDDIIFRTNGECVIMGDFNARVEEVVGDTSVNLSGRKLIEYLEESELCIVVPENPSFTCVNNFGGGVPD